VNQAYTGFTRARLKMFTRSHPLFNRDA